MTDIDTYLAGCDAALAEAERLVAILAVSEDRLEPEFSAARERVTALRREVERLRGMTPAVRERHIYPKRTEAREADSPWLPTFPTIRGI